MSKKRRTVIFASRYSFPDGDPGAARLRGMAQALRLAGYEPLIGSSAVREREEDRQTDGTYRYQGIQYVALDDAGVRNAQIIEKCRDYWNFGSRTARWVREQDLSECCAVVTTGGYAHVHLRLFRHLKRCGVPHVVDCLEWHSIRHSLGIARFLQGPNTEIANRFLNVQAGHIIAISKFFEDYYKQRGCQVVRVPPLVDLSDPKWLPVGHRSTDDPAVRLVYAGTPGRKDQLTPVVLGLVLASQQGVDAVLELIGPSPAELAWHLGRNAGLITRLGPRIVFHNRVPAAVVPAYLARADFSVLVRPKARYSMAGFPTKVAESLAAGLPVICNRTSNIDEYVRDGVEGILLDGNSAEDFARGLTRVASHSCDEWKRMRVAARERARQCFDYREYTEALKLFFDNLSESHRVSRSAA